MVLSEGTKEKTLPVLPDYDSPSALKLFLEQRGLAMQKKFGQNFLVNRAARVRLVDALDVKEGTSVWEIGPGLGAMTAELLDRGTALTAFEIDRGFSAILTDLFAARGSFALVEGDVLKTWKERAAEAVPERFFGNLPYNIAATIIADTISAGVRFEKTVVTVQKEVAVRMTAEPDTRDYSSFSVLCQWAYRVRPVMDLAGGNFWPSPNVESRAVVFERRDDWPGCGSPAFFIKLQRALFASRRKTIKNNLTVFFSDADKALRLLNEAGIDPGIRGECLSVAEITGLCVTAERLGLSDS